MRIADRKRPGLMLLVAAMAVLTHAVASHGQALHAAPDIILRISDARTGQPIGQGEADEAVTMRVAASGVENMVGVQFQVQFDNSVVEIPDDGIVPGPLPSGFLFDSVIRNSQGIAIVVVVGPYPVGASNLAIADITFDLIGNPGQASGLVFADVMAGTAAGEQLAVNPINGAIIIRPASAVTPDPTVTPTVTPTATPEPEPTPAPEQVNGGLCSAPLGDGSGGRMAQAGDFLLLGLAPGVVLLARRWRKQ